MSFVFTLFLIFFTASIAVNIEWSILLYLCCPFLPIQYKLRRDFLIEYTKNIDIDLIIKEDYGLKEFCKNVANDLENRCSNYCYRVRIEQTAKFAKENGYDAFTTTLFVSPYQQHEKIKEICEEMAQKYEIEFLYRDFRPGFRDGQNKARELELYMQKYCGCVFSEEDRYSDKIQKDKNKFSNEREG